MKSLDLGLPGSESFRLCGRSPTGARARGLRIDTILLLAFLLSPLVAVSEAAGDAEREGQGGIESCTCPCPCTGEAVLPASSGRADPPEELVLDSLSDIFEGAPFSHGSHAELAEGCTSCHHHAPPGVHQACDSCHLKERSRPEQFNQPGLKGAYHLQCTVCHEEYGSGPTDCTGCHKMRPNSSLAPP